MKKSSFKIVLLIISTLFVMIPYSVFADDIKNEIDASNEIVQNDNVIGHSIDSEKIEAGITDEISGSSNNEEAKQENKSDDVKNESEDKAGGENITEGDKCSDDISNKNPESELKITVKLNKAEHVKYLDGKSNGMFYPNAALTRADAAKMLYILLDHPKTDDIVNTYVSFRDVDPNEWYAQYIKAMVEYGIMSGYDDGTFRPNGNVTRAQFVKMLAPFITQIDAGSKSFGDISADYWAYKEIMSASEAGVITGYSDGTFRPYGIVTRSQTSAVMNRLLGRHADGKIIYSYDNVRMYPDLSTDFWAYADIMEASVPHQYSINGGEVWTSVTKEKTAMSSGYHVIDGILYYVDSHTGDFARSRIVGGHYFSYDGKYTTGNAHLDSMVRNITKAHTNSNMTQHQMLRALFNYEVKSYTYLSREKLYVGQKGWEESYAVPFFEKGKGNCYSFAAGFYYLAKNIGYDPNTVSGLVGHNRRPHGWVEIKINGVAHIYDPELTMAKRRDGYRNMDLFEMTYKNAIFVYAKS